MPQAPDILPEGYMLNWYRIENVLGRGGFGTTYLAHDTHLDIRVAIKEYLPTEFAVRASDSKVQACATDDKGYYLWGRERFVEEAQLLVKFDHRSIVRVKTCFEANNTAYMVMDYEEGSSLETWFDEKRELTTGVTEEDLQKILHAILDGLEVVHARQFIHRDIKPVNIYIHKVSDHPILLDFGSARQALGDVPGKEPSTMTALVARGYSAPEQYSSVASEQGAWTDIYGLAATMYYGMTGKAPTPAIERGQRLRSGDDQKDDIPVRDVVGDRYSPAFCKGIDHGLAYEKEQRPQSVAKWRTEFPASEALRNTWLKDELAEAPTKVLDTQTSSATSSAMTTKKTLIFTSLIFTSMITMIVLAVIWRLQSPTTISSFQDTLRDGSQGPPMLVLPEGTFLMGSDASETEETDEGPQHQQVIASKFAIGQHEVTIADFKRFVAASNYVTDGEQGLGCFRRTDKWETHQEANWREPGFEQSDSHPVVCVTRKDALAYIEWLSDQTGREYRLPTEAEWEYAARAGTDTARYWGDRAACDFANVSDKTRNDLAGVERFNCRDDYPYTAPVGHYQPNDFRLFDTLGNVWEWTADCWRPNYLVTGEKCGDPVLRSASWSSRLKHLRVANRYESSKYSNRADIGFRLASNLADKQADDDE